ncbi:MAG TPA: UDP-N-acetylmuramoyl-tripeptide--D-alanyl-D-alanine ligase [Bdellovibrionota bacterium]|jgi:UDP-N-acetylmuramoyl-tripeptide--D-alanyl-D-alanine ligase
MKFLNTGWVACALGLPEPKETASLTQISSDTRSLQKGALFVALKSESADGHEFAAKAKEAGATALVHRRGFNCPPGMVSFPVDDTLTAWRSLAAAWRREFTLPVAVVAGSAGKTTSKELLAALFRGKWKNVLHTEASQNGFQGVPATLLRIRPEHEAAVIEVGIDEPGSMIQHLELVAPDAGLLTSIGPEHLEKLGDVDTVEKEEGVLFSVLGIRGGLAAVNLDDARIANQARQISDSQRVDYSLKGPAHVRGNLTVSGNGELWLDVEGVSPKKERFRVPMEGAHNALNLLGALTLAHGLGLTITELYKGLVTFTPPPGRSEVHQWKGCKVLADTYNANPTSVEAALETLFGADDSEGETWVCLGDMLELGTLEERLHRGLADPILKHGVRNVFLFGPRMKKLEDELRGRKFQGTLAHFDSQEKMAERIRSAAKSGDRILIKGSRGMKMENVWKALQSG